MTYLRVNQVTMNEICTTVGVTQPQAINGPNDGDPEYLIPQDIYMRYMAFAQVGPLAIDKPNDTPFALDPSLMEENYCTPRPRPKPRPLFRKNRAEDAGSSAAAGGTAEGGTAAGGSAEGGTAAGRSAEGGTASAAGGSAEGGSAAARPDNGPENAYQQATPPSSQMDHRPQARRSRRTADELARQEATSNTTVGRRRRDKTVRFK